MAEPARALVVEDEELIRIALETVLSEEGLDVRVAPDGRDALSVLDAWRPDVILLDLMMPRMNGWTFRARQLERADLASIPVVVLSGAHEARARLTELGAAAAVSKPFDLDEVVRIVWRVLGQTPAGGGERAAA